jgi:hypothetical protein
MFAWLESGRDQIPNDGLCRYSLAGLEYCGAVSAAGERIALGLRLWESFLVPRGVRHRRSASVCHRDFASFPEPTVAGARARLWQDPSNLTTLFEVMVPYARIASGVQDAERSARTAATGQKQRPDITPFAVET